MSVAQPGRDQGVSATPGGPRPGLTGAELVAAIRDGEVLFVMIPGLEAVTGMSRMMLCQRVRDGSLRARRCGRSIRVLVEAAREFISNGAGAAAAGQSFGGRV